MRVFMKKCTKCGIEKDEAEFSKHDKNKDGLQFWCKLCFNSYRYELRQQCFELFNSKCQRCGETNTDVLTINHIKPPSSDIYNGLKRGGVRLYKQILDNPNLVKYFTLLCANCNMIDYYEKSGYYNIHTNYQTLWFRKKKEKICEMWNNKCFHCFRTFPTELLSLNHINGGGTKEMYERSNGYKNSLFIIAPTDELINRIDSGELELTCFNCNCNRTEYSKWIKQGMAQKKSLNKSEQLI